MKTLAFVIGLAIVALGTAGLIFPSALLALAVASVRPANFYLIAVVRIAFGLFLLSVAPVSRFPRTLRVIAFIPILAGLAMPLVGIDRARWLVDVWLQFGSVSARVQALLMVGVGAFFAYAWGPRRRAA